ncbi:hypothetical protein H112_05482 [Trichophyton rubrum D6]|uniref:Uncharacterized protein n=2 Tax=Trichophyton TaxID=5550 RepID=A0A022VYZ8_TRIRU|nr:hypothetical protein H100_05499 [Trichophyton rubrum MR850]EZF40612.1 hypothetical protein H102_05465 [Trichophyton rubrum CBS 100081]EZF51281.1 hypothetical protein H103_05492 [Trichophyton rubrum CBS 288.86]EZF61806.1 hypothetical protein H104_05481 [Trichophyton rubrum CBS 289.86]EZF72464.1 hypothetical protein H105_05508 [Trichophyton soudanense CBS 452.61]EZF83172.1 hypothetical protein H110_05488 [Trichophyton rubrum MR1448]EZF93881.1 hypothetical protein H113_05536 [Trichophyton rub
MEPLRDASLRVGESAILDPVGGRAAGILLLSRSSFRLRNAAGWLPPSKAAR